MVETSARLLRLLSLLQAHREWSGADLAGRLGVSSRTLRRDVDRLRGLGYPVDASPGTGGGYQLGAGAELPPLLLDDDEAVAVAVGLRTAAGQGIEGIGETSVRALAKLEQVLPDRLRRRVGTLNAVTVPMLRGPGADAVDPAVLTELAQLCRDTERLRFAYRGHDGVTSRRTVEPHRLVCSERRWYLVAWDLGREDWRTFRVDRVTEPYATGARFTPRELPEGNRDAAEFFTRSMARRQPEVRVDVTFRAPADFVTARLPGSLGAAEPDGGGGCRLRAALTDSLEWVALRLALVDCEFEVHGPPQLVEHLHALGARLTRASSAGLGAADGTAVPAQTPATHDRADRS